MAGLAAAFFLLAATSAAVLSQSQLTRWFEHEMGGTASDALAVGDSPMGVGPGCLAVRDIPPDERLFVVPAEACMSAAAAVADPDLGEKALGCLEAFGFSASAEAIVTAALLLVARYAPESAARARWGAYVDTLPWGDAHDSLASHPVVLGETSVIGSRRYEESLASARAVALLTSGLVDVSEERCHRAIILVASRTFNLGRNGWASTVVPMLDMANQPSLSGVRSAGEAAERFRQGYFSSDAFKAKRHPKEGMVQFSMEWSTAEEAGATCGSPGMPQLVAITANAPPHGLKAGEEMLLWYGDAGWGAATPEQRAEEELNFVAQYGFSPWR